MNRRRERTTVTRRRCLHRSRLIDPSSDSTSRTHCLSFLVYELDFELLHRIYGLLDLVIDFVLNYVAFMICVTGSEAQNHEVFISCGLERNFLLPLEPSSRFPVRKPPLLLELLSGHMPNNFVTNEAMQPSAIARSLSKSCLTQLEEDLVSDSHVCRVARW